MFRTLPLPTLQPSALFPYTTLFRSAVAEGDHLVRHGREARAGHEDADQVERICGGQDRKSTRLNSSHRCISYAVFCLKKKGCCNKFVISLVNAESSRICMMLHYCNM